MIPTFKGCKYKLGSQERVEGYFSQDSIGYYVRRIQQEYPGGNWTPCLHRAYIGIVYDRKDDEIVWLIRFEMDTPAQPVLRLMAVFAHEVATISDPGDLSISGLVKEK